MRNKFVRASNVDRFMAAVAALEDLAAPEACLMLAYGDAGSGKSKTGEWWGVQHGAVQVRLKAACTPHWFLTDLVTGLGETDPAHTSEKLFSQAADFLVRHPQPLVIDEIEHSLKNDIRVLDTARDISDLVDIPVILLGREFSVGQLKKHRQLWTRISSVAQFAPASLADVRQCADELCEVGVEDGVVARLHHDAEGHIREVIKGLANIERIGLRGKHQSVGMAQIDGISLTAEWQGKPRSRRAA